jgi:hypothetical protein
MKKQVTKYYILFSTLHQVGFHYCHEKLFLLTPGIVGRK